eukprot:GEMP01068655.1.p1 GENE.GEMP01068655.1~~GEMP01068655.1.p1  ORF type:complete len:100 (+),score=5.24 GEMP01068655.1:732-1031(+)
MGYCFIRNSKIDYLKTRENEEIHKKLQNKMAYSRLCGPIYWFDRRIHFLGSPPKRGSPTPPSLAHSLIPSPTPSLFIELAVAENAPPTNLAFAPIFFGG